MGNRRFGHASTKRTVIFAWPQRDRQSVRDVANKGLESVRNITVKELEQEWTLNSMLLAFAIRGLSCDVHEDCDGSCSDGTHYPGPPLVEELKQELFSLLQQIADPHPSPAAPHDIPHDSCWVEQQNLPKFEYSALNSLAGEIRVLQVKKGLFRSDVVECDLITISLDWRQEFQALSYCWGSSTMSDVMLCNGKRLYIHPSLNAALKTFREHPKLRVQLLWSDAVSIDQANQTEMSEQIPLMRRIYTEATGVFVHLGLVERQISRGLDLMLRLSSIQQHLGHPEEFGAISTADVALPSQRHPCWTEYFTLYLSPWISRTWILQEIALAQNATLGIGRYIMKWEVLERSFEFLKEHGFLETVGQGSKELMIGLLNFSRLQEIRQIARSPDDSSLMEVLRATRNFKVTDPRDKVVGVLGIIRDDPTGLKALSDRSLNTAQVYHRAALYLLKETRSLPDVFAHAGLQRRVGLPEMPSWVPDWYADDSQLNARPLSTFRRTPFFAGGRPQNCFVHPVDDMMYPRELLSPGFCQHRVIRRSSALDQSYFAWFDSARTCLKDGVGLLYEDVEEAFARTLLIDDLYTGANAIRAVTAIEDVVATFRAATARLETPETGNVDPVSSKLMEGTTDEQVETFNFQMMAAIPGRRFAITDTGYMCLVPSSTEIGDAIAILLGFPTPFTIRLEPEPGVSELGLERVRAQLVGDTYMHGVMYAEAFVEAAQTGRPLCEIVLI